MNIEGIIYTAALTRLTEKKFDNAKQLALFMVAQSKHETGDFTSHIFLKANNAFGYSYYKGSIYQTGKGPVADNAQPAANYKTVADSAREMADWLGRRIQSFKKVQTLEQYAEALKYWGYYGDKEANYLAGLHKYFKPNIQSLTDNNNSNNV